MPPVGVTSGIQTLPTPIGSRHLESSAAKTQAHPSGKSRSRHVGDIKQPCRRAAHSCSSTMPVYCTGISSRRTNQCAPRRAVQAKKLVCFGCRDHRHAKPHYQLCHSRPRAVTSLVRSSPARFRRHAPRRDGAEDNHLVVGGLREVVVELSDGVEHPRSVEAEDVIRLTTEPLGPSVGRRGWRDDPLWTHGPHRPQGPIIVAPVAIPSSTTIAVRAVRSETGDRRGTDACADGSPPSAQRPPAADMPHPLAGIHRASSSTGAVVGDGPDRQLRVSRRTSLRGR